MNERKKGQTSNSIFLSNNMIQQLYLKHGEKKVINLLLKITMDHLNIISKFLKRAYY